MSGDGGGSPEAVGAGSGGARVSGDGGGSPEAVGAGSGGARMSGDGGRRRDASGGGSGGARASGDAGGPHEAPAGGSGARAGGDAGGPREAPAGGSGARAGGDAGVFEALRRHVAPGAALGAKLAGQGAVEESALGASVRLSDGRQAIDFGSYGVTLLGHRHPAVVEAVSRQLSRMPTATRVLANPMTAAFTADLAARLGGALEHVWLGSDGADAVEVALKLARRATGRPRVLAVERGFHGKTLGALALTWNPAFRGGLEGLLAHVTHIGADDAGAVEREVARGDVAALVFEPVQGEAGVRPLREDVLRRWVGDAHAAGAFVVSDEVQAGLRRCGPLSLAVAAGLEPDAVLFGKALGGGVMPLSAMLATRELYATLAADPTWHTATFGGHPLACAAGRAALAALDELAARGEELGRAVGDGLRRLAAAHPDVVADVRGVGLLHALEFPSPALAGSVLVDLAQDGVLVSPCLSAPLAIRLLPPMVTTDAQLERALETLDRALGAAAVYLEDEPDGRVRAQLRA